MARRSKRLRSRVRRSRWAGFSDVEILGAAIALVVALGWLYQHAHHLGLRVPLPTLEAAALVTLGALILAVGYRWHRRASRHARERVDLRARGGRDPLRLDPVEFERYCAALLESRGWRVEETKKTGDFGADILARRRGRKMVVQCKRYAKPVGVGGVQEAHAAAAYYRAQGSAVIATRGFTRSARELARRTKTELFLAPGRSE